MYELRISATQLIMHTRGFLVFLFLRDVASVFNKGLHVSVPDSGAEAVAQDAAKRRCALTPRGRCVILQHSLRMLVYL